MHPSKNKRKHNLKTLLIRLSWLKIIFSRGQTEAESQLFEAGPKKFRTFGARRYFFWRYSCRRLSSWNFPFSSSCETCDVWTPVDSSVVAIAVVVAVLGLAGSDTLASDQLPRSLTLKFRLETTSGEKRNKSLGRLDNFSPSLSCIRYNLVSASSHLSRNFRTACSWTLALTFRSGSSGLVMSRK